MSYTRVKICGITRIEDALHAAAEGVDAIGLVFYDKSPRYVTSAQAAEICKKLPAFVTTVALFKDADVDEVRQVLAEVQIDLLQFHGSESAEFCRQFGRPYIKALGMAGESIVPKQVAEYHDARGLLLDGHAPGADGGTGQSFEWGMIPTDLKYPLILAGGLNVDNVLGAVRAVQPYAVDVSSGVESEKGIKDAVLVTAFMNNVRQANNERS
ncbi:MAG: phosphoribosylanthranilate isomerase [Gammaproteobacteria bacterium]|nr:phosphoribosylanthranilate isomerase [Gammaproteobacteria bacterium]MCK5263100.1 phosphoribosylanthranilate isomerase [Gammaproteobacteria bacterium]